MASKYERTVFKRIRKIVGEATTGARTTAWAYNDKHPGYRRMKFHWREDWTEYGVAATIAFKLGEARIPIRDIRIKECRSQPGRYQRHPDIYLALVIKLPEVLTEPTCVHNKELS